MSERGRRSSQSGSDPRSSNDRVGSGTSYRADPRTPEAPADRAYCTARPTFGTIQEASRVVTGPAGFLVGLPRVGDIDGGSKHYRRGVDGGRITVGIDGRHARQSHDEEEDPGRPQHLAQTPRHAGCCRTMRFHPPAHYLIAYLGARSASMVRGDIGGHGAEVGHGPVRLSGHEP
jgi:hypothetical protein